MLRDYQLDALSAIREHLGQHRSTLVESATGTGKTEIFLHLANQWNGRVIILAHRDELIRQPAKRYKKMFGEEVGIEKGMERVQESGHFLDRFKVIVSSVQTMCRPNRMAKFNPADFSLLIIDEAHHAPASTYRRVIDYFQKNESLKLLGVTATPKRSDSLAMGNVFDSVAFRFGIEPAVEAGWLVPITQRVVKVEGLDFSKVKTIKGDLDQDELERILTEEKMLHKVAAPTVEMAGDLPTLVFTVTVKHAELMAAVLNRYKHDSAVYLSGDRTKFPLHKRREIIQRFCDGKIQFLCSCNLLLEGFDAPNAAVLAQARPTKSPIVYTQGLGRITRRYGVDEGIETADLRRAAIAASAKPFGTVLDFVGNAGKHKILQAADILGGKYSIPIREYAKKTLEDEGAAVPLDEALERAEAELALEEEQREWERRQHIKADKAKYRTAEVSPFGASTVSPQHNDQAPKGEPPTGKQIRMLSWLGVSKATALKYTKRQASAVIDKLLKERNG